MFLLPVDAHHHHHRRVYSVTQPISAKQLHRHPSWRVPRSNDSKTAGDKLLNRFSSGMERVPEAVEAVAEAEEEEGVQVLNTTNGADSSTGVDLDELTSSSSADNAGEHGDDSLQWGTVYAARPPPPLPPQR